MRRIVGRIIFICVLIVPGIYASPQEQIKIMDYMYPDEYVVGNVTVSGIRYLDPNAIIGISGLRKNQRISVPGERITQAVEKLWDPSGVLC